MAYMINQELPRGCNQIKVPHEMIKLSVKNALSFALWVIALSFKQELKPYHTKEDSIRHWRLKRPKQYDKAMDLLISENLIEVDPDSGFILDVKDGFDYVDK